MQRVVSKGKPIQSNQTFYEYVRKVDKPTKKNISRIDEILKVIGIEMADKMKHIEADNEFISYRNENTFSGLYNYPEYKKTLFIHEENNEIKDLWMMIL